MTPPIVRLACGAVIDAADLPLVSGITLRRRANGVIEFKRGGKTNGLHRLLMNPEPNEHVDHINGDASDNRRCNLRVCTHAENTRNRKRHKNNKTGVKGVWLDTRRNRYRAQVRFNGTKFNLGSFVSLEDASAAYAKHAAELHGAFFRIAQQVRV